MKDSRIVVPVEKSEKANIIKLAKKRGHDNVAGYVRWLIRQDEQEQKIGREEHF